MIIIDEVKRDDYVKRDVDIGKRDEGFEIILKLDLMGFGDNIEKLKESFY